MQTVDKAMKLLGLFSPARPEIGLSELARLAGLDKEAARRFLVALGSHGFIEQNAVTRAYRLGSAFIYYARIREQTCPLASVVQPVLEALAEETGETAHATLATGMDLVTIGIAEPQRTTRVSLEPSQQLPLHATASGFAFLAFAPAPVREEFLKQRKLEKYTKHTPVTAKAMREQIAFARRTGYAMAMGAFEDEVIGLAAPLFDSAGLAMGTIAVASLASRFTDTTKLMIATKVVAAAIDVSRAMGGEPHAALLRAAKETADA